MSNPADPRLAMDRSMRSHDPFGRMKVEWTNISKANVCPYRGLEIPGYQALGLDANKVYQLWRHPEELAKAARSFDMVPVLDEHIVVDAAHPEKEYIAGTIGSGVRFRFPYLQAPLALWVGDSIDDVTSRRKRQLSCGYGYKPDMTPGVTPEGVAYDGIMRHITGNHVTIVKDGRAGPDVLVADEDPFISEVPPMKRTAVTQAVLAALTGITVPTEQQVALDAALDAAMCASEKAAEAKGKKAVYDAEPDEWEDDPDNKGEKRRKKKNAAAAADSTVKTVVTDTISKDDATKLAKDAADAAVKAALDAERALVAARVDVADVVGTVALDSAEAVYRQALKQENVTGHDTIHASALASVWGIHKVGKSARAQAHDSAAKPSVESAAAVAAIGI